MNAALICGFCGKEVEREKEVECGNNCGGVHHAHCPPACCAEEIDDYVDCWLAGLAEVELERL